MHNYGEGDNYELSIMNYELFMVKYCIYVR